MYIEELAEGESGRGEGVSILAVYGNKVGLSDAKRAVIGVGARVLFYPTLLYNVIRNKIQPEFRWWDEVDEFVLLGAVPFPTDVPCLKQLGVCGVITLNEPYETLVPTSLYLAFGIEHLMLPTRDYLFAPSLGDICQAVDFIHKNASCGKTTYVHCKAGRGRSTTIVLCYLVQHKQMTPSTAYEYVRSSRPRVLLASSQWQAVKEYYHLRVKKTESSIWLDFPLVKSPSLITAHNLLAFNDSSFVMVSKSDLDGYDGDYRWTELSLVYRVQFAGQAALARLSCFWLRCRPNNKLEVDQLELGHHCVVSGVMVNL